MHLGNVNMRVGDVDGSNGAGCALRKEVLLFVGLTNVVHDRPSSSTRWV